MAAVRSSPGEDSSHSSTAAGSDRLRPEDGYGTAHNSLKILVLLM